MDHKKFFEYYTNPTTEKEMKELGKELVKQTEMRKRVTASMVQLFRKKDCSDTVSIFAACCSSGLVLEIACGDLIKKEDRNKIAATVFRYVLKIRPEYKNAIEVRFI